MQKFGPVLLLFVLFPIFSLTGCASFDPLDDLSQLKDDITALSPRVILLEDVPVHLQPTSTACGITTVSIIASYLFDEAVSPEVLLQKYNLSSTDGINQKQMLKYLSMELPGYTVGYKSNLTDSAVVEHIHEQLHLGIPVPVIFSAPNPANEPYHDFHASVVTGLDLEREIVEISNPYGYSESLSLLEFLNRISFRTIRHLPFIQKCVIRLGLVKQNSLYAIEPAGS